MQLLQGAHNNLFLNAGHMAHDLKLCKVRRPFDCQYPVLLSNVEDNISLVSGIENSVDLVEIIPGKGFKTMQNLNTEGLEV